MTPRTHDLTAAIRALSRGGVAPSYQELAAALNLASRACVHRLVRQAEREGLVERLPGRARTLRLAEPAVANVRHLADAALADLQRRIGDELDRRRSLTGIRTNREQS